MTQHLHDWSLWWRLCLDGQTVLQHRRCVGCDERETRPDQPFWSEARQ